MPASRSDGFSSGKGVADDGFRIKLMTRQKVRKRLFAGRERVWSSRPDQKHRDFTLAPSRRLTALGLMMDLLPVHQILMRFRPVCPHKSTS